MKTCTMKNYRRRFSRKYPRPLHIREQEVRNIIIELAEMEVLHNHSIGHRYFATPSGICVNTLGVPISDLEQAAFMCSEISSEIRRVIELRKEYGLL